MPICSIIPYGVDAGLNFGFIMSNHESATELVNKALRNSCRRLADVGFLGLLPVAWLVAVGLAYHSSSLYLAVPFGGFFPLLYLGICTYAPRSIVSGIVAVCAADVLSVCLVYCSGGHAAGLLLIPAGLILGSLYLAVWPVAAGIVLLASISLVTNYLIRNHIDQLWRLNVNLLSPFVSNELIWTLICLGFGSIVWAAYGRWLIANRIAFWPVFQSQSFDLMNQLKELSTQKREYQTQILQLQDHIYDFERISRDKEEQITKLHNQLDAKTQELERIQHLADIQQQEYQRKLVQALSEGVLHRSLTHAKGVLLFRLNASGEILSSNPAANELVRMHKLKQIGSWVLPEQPHLMQPSESRNWKSLRAALSTAPGLLRVRSAGNQTTWVWATAQAVEKLTEQSQEEWVVLALEIDSHLQALASAQNLELVHERDQPAIAQQEQAIRRMQQELKEVGLQLQQEVKLRQAIVAEMPDGVGLLRTMLPIDIIEANPKFWTFATSTDGHTGSVKWIDGIEKQLEHLLDRLTKPEPFSLNYQFTAPNGAMFHLRLMARSLEPAKLTPYWMVVVQDLTRVQQAEQLFEQVAETSPTPFLIAGMSSRRLIYGNPSLQTLLGYSAAELTELMPDDLLADHRQRADLIVSLKRKGSVESFPVLLKTHKRGLLRALVTLRVAQLLGERCILGSFVLVAETDQPISRQPNYSIGGWTLDLGTLVLELDELFRLETGINMSHLKLHEFTSRLMAIEDASVLNNALSRMVKTQQTSHKEQLIYRIQSPNGILTLESTLVAVTDSSGILIACRADHIIRLDP
jgi:PAS domain S-box-containing protein